MKERSGKKVAGSTLYSHRPSFLSSHSSLPVTEQWFEDEVMIAIVDSRYFDNHHLSE